MLLPRFLRINSATVVDKELKCILSGRPSASHYFIGVQDSYLFYLDPHHTRPALPYRGSGDVYTEEELDSYHSRRLRRLHVREMDPSVLIGFLIKNEGDWVDWKRRVSTADGKSIVNICSDGGSASIHERQNALDEVEVLDDDMFSE
jgi:cysteine protease ATG4